MISEIKKQIETIIATMKGKRKREAKKTYDYICDHSFSDRDLEIRLIALLNALEK